MFPLESLVPHCGFVFIEEIFRIGRSASDEATAILMQRSLKVKWHAAQTT